MTHEDPWAPGSTARFERGEPTPFAPLDTDTRRAASEPAFGGPSNRVSNARRRFVMAAAALAFVGIGVVASINGAVESPANEPSPTTLLESPSLPEPEGTLDDALDGEVPPDDGDDVVLGVGDVPLATGSETCVVRRLPDEPSVRWVTTVVPENGAYDERVFAVGGLALVTTHEDARSSASADLPVVTDLVGLDLRDGIEVWRSSFFGAADRSLSVRAASAGVILVEFVRGARTADPENGRPEGRVVVGIDAATGEERWTRVFERSVRIEARDGATGFLAVDELGVSGAAGTPSVTLHDIASSQEVGTWPGRLLGLTDRDGVVLLDGSEVRVGDEWIQFAEARVGSVAVAGSTLVVHHDGATFTGVDLVDDGWRNRRQLALTGSMGIAPPSQVDRIEALGGTSMLVEAEGAIYGANVSRDTIELRWRRAGELIGSEPGDRGRLVALSPNTVGRFPIVVDGSTGRTIFASEPDVLALGPHANGLSVVREGSTADVVASATFEVTVLDLDGREQWVLSGAGVPGAPQNLAVGDRVAVAAVETEPGSEILVTAWGPVPTEPATCGTVVREWVTT